MLSVNSQNIFLKNSIENLGISSGSYNGRTSVSIEIAEMSHQHQQFKLFFTVDEFSKLLSKKKEKKEIKLNQRDKPLLNKQILRFNIISNSTMFICFE